MNYNVIIFTFLISILIIPYTYADDSLVYPLVEGKHIYGVWWAGASSGPVDYGDKIAKYEQGIDDYSIYLLKDGDPNYDYFIITGYPYSKVMGSNPINLGVGSAAIFPDIIQNSRDDFIIKIKDTKDSNGPTVKYYPHIFTNYQDQYGSIEKSLNIPMLISGGKKIKTKKFGEIGLNAKGGLELEIKSTSSIHRSSMFYKDTINKDNGYKNTILKIKHQWLGGENNLEATLNEQCVEFPFVVIVKVRSLVNTPYERRIAFYSDPGWYAKFITKKVLFGLTKIEYNEFSLSDYNLVSCILTIDNIKNPKILLKSYNTLKIEKPRNYMLSWNIEPGYINIDKELITNTQQSI